MNRIAQCCDCVAQGDDEPKIIYSGWSTRNQKRCSYHTKVHRNRNKKPINKAPTEKLKDDRKKDWDLNRELWNTRPRICVETGVDLGKKFGDNPPKYVFSHLLTKGARGSLRHEARNIVFHSKKAHHQWEFGDRRSMKTYQENIEWMVSQGYVEKDL